MKEDSCRYRLMKEYDPHLRKELITTIDIKWLFNSIVGTSIFGELSIKLGVSMYDNWGDKRPWNEIIDELVGKMNKIIINNNICKEK